VTPTTEPLARLLDEQLAALHRFVALLEDERRALLSNAIDALGALAEAKSRSAAEIERFAPRCRDLFARAGLAPGTAAVDALAQRAGERGRVLAGGWEALQGVARKARRLNHENGLLLAQLRGHNERLLDGLRAAAGAPRAVYGPDGRSVGDAPAGSVLLVA